MQIFCHENKTTKSYHNDGLAIKVIMIGVLISPKLGQFSKYHWSRASRTSGLTTQVQVCFFLNILYQVHKIQVYRHKIIPEIRTGHAPHFLFRIIVSAPHLLGLRSPLSVLLITVAVLFPLSVPSNSFLTFFSNFFVHMPHC